MAVDMFMKLTDLKGEAQDAKHKGEIEVLSWSWGMNQTGTTHIGTGGGSGKVSVSDLTFTHYIDMASADLIQSCCNGKHFVEALLTVRKASGKAQIEYLKIKMNEVIITHVSTGGSNGQERVTENVTLNFQKFEYQYTQQMPDGSSGKKPQARWDMAKNAEV